jgi:hypothetical protein
LAENRIVGCNERSGPPNRTGRIALTAGSGLVRFFSNVSNNWLGVGPVAPHDCECQNQLQVAIHSYAPERGRNHAAALGILIAQKFVDEFIVSERRNEIFLIKYLPKWRMRNSSSFPKWADTLS